MSVEGIWDLSIATPIGVIKAAVELRGKDTGLTGVARGTAEEVPLRDVELAGDQLTWKQSTTKPLRLNLTFAVTVDGDTLAGTSRPTPSVMWRIWPLAWECQLVRAPGVNRTRPTARRAGSVGASIRLR
ncbi:hypothetical protein [Streptomyces sp. NPDC004721]